MMKKVLAVSFLAMLVVPAAQAVIVSQENIVGANGVTVNVPTDGTNKGKVVVSGPNLPTVNNAKLTIQKNGTTIDTFTANASADKTINIAVSKSDVGLGNVDNTSDANKPISTATQTALNGKVDKTVAGEANKVMVRNSSGTMVPATIATYEDNKGAEHAQLSVSNGTISINYAENAGSAAEAEVADWAGGADVANYAEKAVKDENENNIVETYATKTELSGKANTSHNQASNTINAMTGYAKPSSTSAIATGDTLNAAIGKLEKALDGKQASGSYVPTSTTVNSKALSGNITLNATDVGAVASTQTTKGGILTTNSSSGAVEVSSTIAQSQVSGLTTALSGKVPTTTTVNGKALSGNIALSASDVGAVASAQGSTNKDKVMITNNSDGTVTSTKFVHYSSTGGSNVYSSSATDKDTTIPSVRLVESIANTAAGNYVPLDQGSNTNKVMLTNGSGQVVTGTITNTHIASGAAIDQSKINGLTTALSNAQNKIPSGSENSTDLASIWVE